MPLGKIEQPSAPQKPKPPQLSWLLVYAFLGLSLGIAAEEFRWRNWQMPSSNQVVRAEQDVKSGDYQSAMTLFDGLAKKNNPLAQYWIADMDELGLGVAPDPAKAIDLYKKAAAQGITAADLRLGEIYLHGNLVLPDFAQAKSYLEKAAYSGKPRAAMLLGQMYHDGIGMPADQTQAYAWSEVARLEGSVFAQQDRDASFHDLSEADQKTALAQAQNILKSVKKDTTPVSPPIAK